MTEREAFLAAIAEAPHDDVPRLVYADWLDERDDPLGEFIRLQLELEPLRIPRSDPRAELERNRLLHKIPPGKDYPDRKTPLACKLDRERELLRSYQADWLGSVADLKDQADHFSPEFRRGFVASAKIGLSEFREHGAALRRACPTLQELIILGTLGQCGSLAVQPALEGLAALTLAGWINAADADALARSPHLAALWSLTVWIDPEGEEDSCRALARLPGLRELVLVQLWGGVSTNHPEEFDRRADQLAASVNAERGQPLARVERPFTRLFPLDGIHIGYGINAGHLPGGQPVLVTESNRPVLIHFDADGRMLREEQLDLTDKLFRPPPFSWEKCDAKELIEVLGREIGFVPGPIFVREFSADAADVGVCCWGIHEEAMQSPATIDPDESEEIGGSISWWLSPGQFCLPFGNCYWADGLGRIHSS